MEELDFVCARCGRELEADENDDGQLEVELCPDCEERILRSNSGPYDFIEMEEANGQLNDSSTNSQAN